MSFTYGGTSTDSLAGVTARLLAWPSLGGLSLSTIEKSGPGGRFFSESSQSHSQFVHEVTIWNDKPSDARRDNFVGLLDPSRGPRDLILETDTAWKSPDVLVSAGIDWQRLSWDERDGFVWRAEVAMETVGDPYAVQVSPFVQSFTSSVNFTLALGNTASFPTVEFPSGAAATVKVGAHTVSVGATPTGSTVVLDYENFEFFRRSSGGARVGSVVGLMSNFDRPQLQLGVSTAVSVTGAPAGTRRLYPNARRI